MGFCSSLANTLKTNEHVIAIGFNRTRILETFPEMGRRVPEVDSPDIREIIYRSYRIFYRLKPEHSLVEVIRFWHAARGFPIIPRGRRYAPWRGRQRELIARRGTRRRQRWKRRRIASMSLPTGLEFVSFLHEKILFRNAVGVADERRCRQLLRCAWHREQLEAGFVRQTVALAGVHVLARPDEVFPRVLRE